jgi:hypothetical protein
MTATTPIEATVNVACVSSGRCEPWMASARLHGRIHAVPDETHAAVAGAELQRHAS